MCNCDLDGDDNPLTKACECVSASRTTPYLLTLTPNNFKIDGPLIARSERTKNLQSFEAARVKDEPRHRHSCLSSRPVRGCRYYQCQRLIYKYPHFSLPLTHVVFSASISIFIYLRSDLPTSISTLSFVFDRRIAEMASVTGTWISTSACSLRQNRVYLLSPDRSIDPD